MDPDLNVGAGDPVLDLRGHRGLVERVMSAARTRGPTCAGRGAAAPPAGAAPPRPAAAAARP